MISPKMFDEIGRHTIEAAAEEVREGDSECPDCGEVGEQYALGQCCGAANAKHDDEEDEGCPGGCHPMCEHDPALP